MWHIVICNERRKIKRHQTLTAMYLESTIVASGFGKPDFKFQKNFLERWKQYFLLQCLPPQVTFWEIFENCQLKTLLNSKILPNSYGFFENFIVTIFLGTVQFYSKLFVKIIKVQETYAKFLH